MKMKIAKRYSVILLCGFVLGLITGPAVADFNNSSGGSRWKANQVAADDTNQSPWRSRKIDIEEQQRDSRKEQRRERSESQPGGTWKPKPQQKPKPDRDGTPERKRDSKPEQRREHRERRSPPPREQRPDSKWRPKPVPKPDEHRTPRDRRRDGPRSENRDRHRHDQQRHDHRYRHRHPHRHESPRHRPRYKYYKRHRHVYYRSPWYSTWFLAPIIWHFHSIGYELLHLPKGYVRIVVGGLPYFYFNGVFYRSYRGGYITVAAPLGAYVEILPLGAVAFPISTTTYYYVNDTYYMWDAPRAAYVVVEKPVGAEKAMEEATQGRLFVYPNEGQDEEQQAKDRYECHRWAVSATDVDPTLEDRDLTIEEEDDYKRALSACLEGRGYTVK